MIQERKRTEARQEEILRVALTILDEEGIHALTLRELSVRIGISEAALFRHFDGKDDIVNDLADWLIEDCVVEEVEGSDLWSTLLDLMRRQFEAFTRFPASTSVFFQEETFRGFPEAKRRFDERRRKRAEWIARLLEEAKGKGELDPDVEPEVLARIYMGAMRMEVLEWRASGYSYDLVAKAEPIMRQLRKLLPREIEAEVKEVIG